MAPFASHKLIKPARRVCGRVSVRRSSSSDRLRELASAPPSNPGPAAAAQTRSPKSRYGSFHNSRQGQLSRVLRYTCVVVMVVVVITIIAAAIVVVIGHLLASSHALSPSLFFSRSHPRCLPISLSLRTIFIYFAGDILAGSRISLCRATAAL